MLGKVVLAVCIRNVRARWVIHTPYVRSFIHWTGVYPGLPGYTQSSGTRGAKTHVCPVAH